MLPTTGIVGGMNSVEAFRHSDLTYGESDVNKTLAEVWAGIEWRTSSGWALQYLACWESPELRWGSGSRSFTWGSIEISKTFP